MLRRRPFSRSDIVISVKKYFPKQLLSVYRAAKKRISPYKGARVYIRRGISRTQFFDRLNERNIEYVLLRWWGDFPEMEAGEDMDILIRDEQRDLINDLLTFHDYGTDLKCDIYTVEGSKYGSHKNLPYFQNRLSCFILETRQLFRGVYVPGGMAYFSSLAYHALFHKGDGSGLSGFETCPDDLEHNYSTILDSEAKHLGIQVVISAQGIYDWLDKQKFLPAEDTLSKLVEIRPELAFLQKSLFSDIRGGELLVFVIRERLMSDGLLETFIKFLKTEYNFEIINVRILDNSEKAHCKSHIRGGKWDNGPYKLSGGPPAAYVSVFDYSPQPLDEVDMLTQPRMTNRNNYIAKNTFRTYLNDLPHIGNYNGVHSADNEFDALSYISLLGGSYLEQIKNQVESFRVKSSQIT